MIVGLILLVSFLGCDCGYSISKRVFDGLYARNGDYPWMAAMMYNSDDREKVICGATLISKSYAVTALHCTYRDPGNTYLLVGTTDVTNRGSPTQLLRVSRFILYHQNRKNLFDDGIAIVELLDDAVFGFYVQPISLPLVNQDFAEVRAIFVGYGAPVSDPKGVYENNKLKFGHAVVPSNKECNDAIGEAGGYVYPNKICAATYGGAPGACTEDSGGPLTYYNRTTKNWILIGISSYSHGCSNNRDYGVFNRVSNYTDWIKEISSIPTPSKDERGIYCEQPLEEIVKRLGDILSLGSVEIFEILQAIVLAIEKKVIDMLIANFSK